MTSPHKSLASTAGGDDAAIDVDVTVAANQEMVLFNLTVGFDLSTFDGGAWTLECPAGTTRLSGIGPVAMNFGEAGLAVPYTARGDDVQLTVAAAGAGIACTASLVYMLRTGTRV